MQLRRIIQNQRVKVLPGGDMIAFGTGTDVVHLQRLGAGGTVFWTISLAAPQAHAVDLDLDAAGNAYIYFSFGSGQLRPAGLFGVDGRAWPLRSMRQGDDLLIDTSDLPPGTFVLRTAASGSLRFAVAE